MAKIFIVDGSPRFLVPTDFSSLAFWFTAKDANSVILSGSNVQQWQDKSGNGRNIFAPNPTNRPLWVPAHTDGLPLIRLDGIDDILANETTGTNGLTNVTILSIFRVREAVGQDIPLSLGSSGFTNGSIRAFYRSSGSGVMRFSQWGELAGSTYSADIGGGFHLWGAQNSSGSPNTLLGRDGITTGSSLSYTPTVNGFAVGSLVNNITTFASAIDIREILVFSGSLSASNLQKAEGYLMHQWDMQGLLPVAHPFKNRPPLVSD